MPAKKPENQKNKSSSPAALYIELFETVRDTLTKSINKTQIEDIISRITGHFMKWPYNDLLLYTYTYSKSNYIMAHISNNVILSIGFGHNIGLSQDDLIELGTCAFCHDFGMAEYIHLFQKGHQLTEEENKMIKNHPRKSADFFKDLYSDRIIKVMLDVHENVNGLGYPSGKSGIEISFFAKIISICDVFEALTHPRNFRKEFNPYEAIKIIIKKKNIIFDDKVLKKFVEFMSIYPIGSIVYLNTGEIAIVTASNKGYPTRSIVQILLNPKKEIDKNHRTIDLLKDDMVYIIAPVEPKIEKEIIQVLKPRGNFNLQ
ncbi:MAG: hypothetical protein K8S27_10095 [Candidatus Omnitrophica bacterium]|nr:hypothetical protein [Candidatus Omnitrophota bacterium]